MIMHSKRRISSTKSYYILVMCRLHRNACAPFCMQRKDDDDDRTGQTSQNEACGTTWLRIATTHRTQSTTTIQTEPNCSLHSSNHPTNQHNGHPQCASKRHTTLGSLGALQDCVCHNTRNKIAIQTAKDSNTEACCCCLVRTRKHTYTFQHLNVGT